MSTGIILVTFALIFIAASIVLALLFHFWPRYGSVEAAITQTDHILEQMEAPSTGH